MTASSTLVEPAWFSSPPYVETLGPEVAEICELAGFIPDPEQRLALDAIFGLKEDRTPSADEAAIVAPRQNIKTGLFKQCALGWLFVTDQRLIIWSAHEFSTAREAYRDLKELVDGSDWLRRRVYKTPDTHGQEGIELVTGQRVLFKARTKTGGRGLTGDKVVLDEGFALQPGHMGSLVPTMSARPHGQILYGSSAGLVTSAVLRSIRDRGRSKTDPGLVYLEFCDDLSGECELGDRCTHVIGSPDCRLDDVARWGRANSQLYRRIPLQAIERERRSLPPEEFGRERLGWWDEPEDDGSGLDITAWKNLTAPDAELNIPMAFGVATAPDRKWSAVAVAWRRVDGTVQVELTRDELKRLDYRPSATWIESRAAELRRRWHGPVFVNTAARGLIPGAQEPPEHEQARAHNGLSDRIEAGTVHHGNQPALNTAIRGTKWKFRENTRVLDQRGAVDISPAIAAALAVWGLDHRPEPRIHEWPSDEEIAQWEETVP